MFTHLVVYQVSVLPGVQTLSYCAHLSLRCATHRGGILLWWCIHTPGYRARISGELQTAELQGSKSCWEQFKRCDLDGGTGDQIRDLKLAGQLFSATGMSPGPSTLLRSAHTPLKEYIAAPSPSGIKISPLCSHWRAYIPSQPSVPSYPNISLQHLTQL